jgi:thiosulfate/3-mercaptopyruvate sulfurtransferase
MTDESAGPLVAADWVADNLDRFRSDDPAYRLVEVNIERAQYETAHIPGAVGFDWRADLQDTATFDVVAAPDLEQLLGTHGITPETTVVLYGDFYNWFAAHAYWLLRYYGHDSLRLLDGGRKYWLDEAYPTTTDTPAFETTDYSAATPDQSIRADREHVEQAIEAGTPIVDVRAPPEYRGEIVAPPGWNEGVQRGGHVPGAENRPWSRAVRADGRLKPRDALEALYGDLRGADETVIYCRIGERSAFTWFVLSELLGFEGVRHYYGSWVEWGNTVGLPVERPAETDLR